MGKPLVIQFWIVVTFAGDSIGAGDGGIGEAALCMRASERSA
jgi:hypothetical protein